MLINGFILHAVNGLTVEKCIVKLKNQSLKDPVLIFSDDSLTQFIHENIFFGNH